MSNAGPGTFTEFPCDLCGSDEAVEVPHAREYTAGQPVHICKHCGLVYVKYRRSAKEIADTWSGEFYGGFYKTRIPAVRARHVYAADYANVNIGLKNKKVCDIGAGEGQFLDIIRTQYGAKVFGIEPSAKNCAELSGLGIDNFNGTVEDYCAGAKRNKRKFDIVTIIWTLENCRSCRDMLRGAYDILGNGGDIVIETGSRILVPFKKPLYLYLAEVPADTNSFRFSANTLKGILAVSGFETTHVNRYIDSDVLCVIAKKMPFGRKIKWAGDDFSQVYDFFERWHKETAFYKRENYNL